MIVCGAAVAVGQLDTLDFGPRVEGFGVETGGGGAVNGAGLWPSNLLALTIASRSISSSDDERGKPCVSGCTWIVPNILVSIAGWMMLGDLRNFLSLTSAAGDPIPKIVLQLMSDGVDTAATSDAQVRLWSSAK